MHYTVVAFRGLELAGNIVNVLRRYKHSIINESTVCGLNSYISNFIQRVRRIIVNKNNLQQNQAVLLYRFVALHECTVCMQIKLDLIHNIYNLFSQEQKSYFLSFVL